MLLRFFFFNSSKLTTLILGFTRNVYIWPRSEPDGPSALDQPSQAFLHWVLMMSWRHMLWGNRAALCCQPQRLREGPL